MRRPRPETLAALIGILAFVVVVLGPSLIGLRVFAGMDLIRLTLPFSRAAPLTDPVDNIFVRDTVDSLLPAYVDFHDRLREGDIASWASYNGGGSPVGSLPTYALFSPLALPYWLLPTWLAPAFSQLLQIALSLGGMYLFLRRLSCGRAAGLVGGMVFVTSGFMVAWVNWQHTKVGAFIPLLFWALERFVQLRTLRAAVPVAVAVAGLSLGGFPAVAGLALYAGGAYLVVRLLAERRGRSWLALLRDGGTAALAVALGLGVTAAQLLPLASYLGTVDLSYRDNQFFATTPLRYGLSALFPQSFFVNRYGAGSPFGREINPIEIAMHVGSVAVLLIGLALLRGRSLPRPRGVQTFLLLTSVLSLWLIFVQGPLVTWMAVLPIFDGNPIGRLRAVLGFTAAALAGLGFDALVRGAEPLARRRRAERLAIPAGLVGLLVLGVIVDRAQTPLFGPGVRTDVVLACGAALLAGGLVLAATRWPTGRRLVAVVIPLLVAVQGLVAVQNYWSTARPEDFYPTTAAHEFLAENLDGQRIAQTGDVLLPSTTAAYGLRLVGGHSFIVQSWAELLRGVDPETFVVPTISTFDPRRPQVATSPGLDRMAVRYYVSSDDAPIPGTPSPTGPADGTVATSPTRPTKTEIPAQALRGIGFFLAGTGPDGSALSPDARARVTVVDAVGELVAAGERPLPEARVPGDVYVPLAAEDAAGRPGPFTVSISLSDRLGGRPPGLVATAGAPRLVVVGPAPDGLRLVAVLDGVTIYERADALPRIRWAGRTVTITDPAERVAAVVGGGLTDDEVVLSRAGPAGGGGDAEVEVLEDSGDTVRVRVAAEGAGYLVLADAVQTDWVVSVDGEDAALVAADHAFGAVYVTAGVHDVAFRYAPRGRGPGLLLSGLSLALVVGAATLPTRRRAGTAPTAV